MSPLIFTCICETTGERRNGAHSASNPNIGTKLQTARTLTRPRERWRANIHTNTASVQPGSNSFSSCTFLCLLEMDYRCYYIYQWLFARIIYRIYSVSRKREMKK